MPNLEVAEKADKAFKACDPKVPYHVSYSYISRSKLFDAVRGTVIYVGCGRELSSLFAFENALTYIHQDLDDPNLPPALSILEKEGIISAVEVLSDEESRGVSRFTYRGVNKRLVEVHGPPYELDEDGIYRRETPENPGNVGFFVPNEAREGLEAIYFFAIPYPDAIKMVQINLLPYLKINGIFHGAYPYNDGRFEGAPPHELGLAQVDETFIKTRHLTKEEIKRIVGFSASEYRRRLELREANLQRHIQFFGDQ